MGSGAAYWTQTLLHKIDFRIRGFIFQQLFLHFFFIRCIRRGVRSRVQFELQRVSKILTPHRLLRNWFAVAYFEAEITRFPNMYDKGGVFSQILSRKTFLSKKKA